MSMIPTGQLLTDQQMLVLRMHDEEGMSYREIAGQLGVSRGRVYQIRAEALRKQAEYEENPADGFALLPVRVKHCLENCDYGSRSQVLEAIQSGRMWWDEKWSQDPEWDAKTHRSRRPGHNMARVRNFGWQSWAALNHWLGLGNFQEMMAEGKNRREQASQAHQEIEVPRELLK